MLTATRLRISVRQWMDGWIIDVVCFSYISVLQHFHLGLNQTKNEIETFLHICKPKHQC